MTGAGANAGRATGAAAPLRPRSAPLLLLLGVCVAGVICAYLFWVRTHAGQSLDQHAFDGRLTSARARASADAVLSTITIGSLAVALCVLSGQTLLRHRPTLALLGSGIVVVAVAIAEGLKHFVLTRPVLLVGGAAYHNSFPSGHTTIAFSVGIAAIVVAPPRWRRAVTALAFAWSSMIAVAVVAAGWHRPSDAVGAMLIATGTAAALTLLVITVDRDAFAAHRRGVRRARSAPAGEEWPGPRVRVHYVVLAVVLIAAGAVAAVVVAGLRATGVAAPPVGAGFVIAIASLVALDAILLAALLGALGAFLPDE